MTILRLHYRLEFVFSGSTIFALRHYGVSPFSGKVSLVSVLLPEHFAYIFPFFQVTYTNVRGSLRVVCISLALMERATSSCLCTNSRSFLSMLQRSAYLSNTITAGCIAGALSTLVLPYSFLNVTATVGARRIFFCSSEK